ncbi:YqhG family protein [Calidifontibacillus erzurumensis]|uniref:YqhG family protein n=1 Tax=Calidifontibacillus erzurumensis TaxID=2741433 RepID=UPI0035B54A69
MQQQDIHNFLKRYFSSNGCEIIENSPGHLVVQLTVELDKELMNRPFYWHYIEKTGGQGTPMKLTFITDRKKVPDGVKGEAIHFGSPRLHQIFRSTKKMASSIRMFEQVETNVNRALYPWLLVNLKASYICDRKKDLLFSLGLNLINGVMIDQAHKKIMKKNLTPKIPDYCFTLSPLIKPKSGLKRIERMVMQIIENDDHQWAEEAHKRWQKDLHLLDHFYEDLEEKRESYFTEKAALEAQYKPKIKIEIINGGLFYLTDQVL